MRCNDAHLLDRQEIQAHLFKLVLFALASRPLPTLCGLTERVARASLCFSKAGMTPLLGHVCFSQ
jgi:hypothetical protein